MSSSYSLKIKILNDNADLKKKYSDKLVDNIKSKSTYKDSGFDLICPSEIKCNGQSLSTMVGLGVTCAVTKNGKPCGYYLYPRSSISKTTLRMANSVGVIDSGYRGELIAAVDNIGNQEFKIEYGDRYFQICTPDLTPFSGIEIVDELDVTQRGAGGFGSTGK
jgi:dUTP pyrophosphatase